MIKFNDTNIFTGYIKQLLKSFNLPKYHVYTKEQEEYHNNYLNHSKEISTIMESLAVVEEELTTATGDTKKELLKEKDSLLHQLANLGVDSSGTPEKDILVSMYRQQPNEYKNNKVTETKYPLHMRYIPYIRHGEVQLYAPTAVETITDLPEGGREVTTKITYSDNDWKPFHGVFENSHGKIHKDTDELFVSKSYIYNRKLRNGTKNLIIDNNTYDVYTHEYLGDFLRFHRDYYGIDLMPLYNCFSNTTCPHLNVAIKVTSDKKDPVTGEIISKGYTAEFNSSDTSYKIYMVPIKFFKKYTIAIDCNEAVELCCGLYGQYAYNSIYNEIMQNTYVCYNNMRFDKPELFDITDKLKPYLSPEHSLEVAQHEDDLKLFIKLPINNKSSIVILEGDYTDYQNPLWNGTFEYKGIPVNDTKIIRESSEVKLENTVLSIDNTLNDLSVKNDTLNLKAIQIDPQDRRQSANTGAVNSNALSITNNQIYNGKPGIYEYNIDDTVAINKTVINFEDESKLPQKLITPLQLLKLNTGESYPFANRLLEFLIGNTITPIDSIGDNIERVKVAVNKKLGTPYQVKNNNIWEEKLKYLFYSYVTSASNSTELNHDITGYVDKDIESHYSYINKMTRYRNGIKINELDATTIKKILMYKNGYKFSIQEAEKLKKLIDELDIDIRTISSTNIYGDDEWED